MLEEVLDLGQQQLGQIVDVFHVVVDLGQLGVRYRHQLGIFTGFVGHVQDAHRATANHGAGYHRVGGDNQYVQRVAVFGQGVGDVAVVGRIEHGGCHEAVYEYGVAVFVDLVLDRVSVGRDFDGHVDVFGEVFPGGNLSKIHGLSFSTGLVVGADYSNGSGLRLIAEGRTCLWNRNILIPQAVGGWWWANRCLLG